MKNLNIEIVSPVDKAISHTKKMLFPFNAEIWFSVGFCAFLAYLGQNLNFSNNIQRFDSNAPSSNLSVQVNEFYMSLKPFIPAVMIGGVLLALIVKIILLKLSCRGQFMFNHNIAGKNSDVKKPWRIYSRHANSLFKFLLAILIIPWIITISLILAAALFAISSPGSFTQAQTSFASSMYFGFIITFAILALLIALPLMIIKVLTVELIVPIMITKNYSCLDSWKYLNHITNGCKSSLVLFLLFRIVINIVVGFIIIALSCITCCILGCLFSVPYIGSVATLPFTIVVRSYSLKFLAQFGEDVNIFDYYAKMNPPKDESAIPQQQETDQALPQTQDQPTDQQPENSSQTKTNASDLPASEEENPPQNDAEKPDKMESEQPDEPEDSDEEK